MSTQVKICGVCNVDDALEAVECGATLLGVNFVPASPRVLSVKQARAISDAVSGRVELVGVVANLPLSELEQLRTEAGIDTLQLHGDEEPELFLSLSTNDYKAVRIATGSDVQAALRYPGPRLLVDAKAPHVLGGSGQTFDWNLVVNLALERKLLLAGGLRPDNVRDAVTRVRPWVVDVASGVELHPRRKDPALVRAFVRNAMS